MDSSDPCVCRNPRRKITVYNPRRLSTWNFALVDTCKPCTRSLQLASASAALSATRWGILQIVAMRAPTAAFGRRPHRTTRESPRRRCGRARIRGQAGRRPHQAIPSRYPTTKPTNPYW